MERFTVSIAATLKCPLAIRYLMRNQVEILNIMCINVHYVHLFANVNFDNSLVNLEGHICKSKIVLTKPVHLTPTYAMPNT